MRYLLYIPIFPLLAVAILAKCVEVVGEGIFDLCAYIVDSLHPYLP